jgi:hypothetical protein
VIVMYAFVSECVHMHEMYSDGVYVTRLATANELKRYPNE